MHRPQRPHGLRQRLGHGAHHAWKRTTNLGRRNIIKLCAGLESCTPMSGGRSGYCVAFPDGRTVRLRGANNVLSQIAWTGRALPRSRAGDARRPGGPTVLTSGRTYFGTSAGVERGKDVHQELQDFITMPPKEFRARYKEVDPMTRAMMLALNGQKLVGVAAELIVHDASIGCGTAIDALCLDKRGRLVAVELKTGYGRASFLAPLSKGKRMRAPFSQLADSPLNRAHLQLEYGVELLRRSYGVEARGLVVHVTRECEVRVHETPDTLRRLYRPLIFEGAERTCKRKKRPRAPSSSAARGSPRKRTRTK